MEKKVEALNESLASVDGKALISINKALVTRASAVIPAVPLYIALLYRVMKSKHLHEGCIHQMYRLYHDFLFNGDSLNVDTKGRIRLDDWEMRPDVQNEIKALWHQVNQENIHNLADIAGVRDEFLRHHGFGMPGIDYAQDVSPDLL